MGRCSFRDPQNLLQGRLLQGMPVVPIHYSQFRHECISILHPGSTTPLEPRTAVRERKCTQNVRNILLSFISLLTGSNTSPSHVEASVMCLCRERESRGPGRQVTGLTRKQILWATVDAQPDGKRLPGTLAADSVPTDVWPLNLFRGKYQRTATPRPRPRPRPTTASEAEGTLPALGVLTPRTQLEKLPSFTPQAWTAWDLGPPPHGRFVLSVSTGSFALRLAFFSVFVVDFPTAQREGARPCLQAGPPRGRWA